MAAHLRDITRSCEKCRRRASKALYNTRNALQGYFCGRCAPRALREFKRRVGEDV